MGFAPGSARWVTVAGDARSRMTMSVLSRLRGLGGRDRAWIRAGWSGCGPATRSTPATPTTTPSVAAASPARAGPGPAPILEQGRELLRVLDAAAAREIQHDVETRFPLPSDPAEGAAPAVLRHRRRAWSRALLERIVTREVDERAARFFGSEYFVYWFTVTRATPVRRARSQLLPLALRPRPRRDI